MPRAMSSSEKLRRKQPGTHPLATLDEKSQSEPRLEGPPVPYGSASALSSQTEQKSREPPEQPLVEYGDIRRPSISVNEGELGSQPPAGEHPRKSIGSVDYGDPGPEKSDNLPVLPHLSGDNVEPAKEPLDGIWSVEELAKGADIAPVGATSLAPLKQGDVEEKEGGVQPVLAAPVSLPPPPAPPPVAAQPQVAGGKNESSSKTASGSGSSSEGSESETSTSGSSSTGSSGSSSGSTSGTASKTTGSTSGSSSTGSTGDSQTKTSTATANAEAPEKAKAVPGVSAAPAAPVPPAAVKAPTTGQAVPPEKGPSESSGSSSSGSSSGSSSDSESSSESGESATEPGAAPDAEKEPLLAKPLPGAVTQAQKTGDTMLQKVEDKKLETKEPAGQGKPGVTARPTSGTEKPRVELPKRPPVPPGGLRAHRPPPPAAEPAKAPPPPAPSSGSGKGGNDPSVYAGMNNEIHRDAETKNRRVPCCLLVANIVITLILVLLSYGLVIHQLDRIAKRKTVAPPPEVIADDHVCRDVQCSSAGTHLFYVLNNSANPCHSIYNYVCKGWIHEGPSAYRKIVLGAERIFVDSKYIEMKDALLAYQTRPSESAAVRKATDLYRMCLEEPVRNPKDTKLIESVLQKYELSNWPFSQGTFLQNSHPYVSLGKFIADTGAGAIVAVKALPDPENFETRVYGIDCSTFVVPMGTLLSFAEHKDYTLLGYKMYIKDVISALSPGKKDIDSLANTIMAFEINLAARCNKGCRKKRYKRTNLKQLDAESKGKRTSEYWLEFLKTVSGDNAHKVTDDMPILVRSERYLRIISTLFEQDETRLRVMNYIGWRVVHHFMRHAGVHFRNMTESFFAARIKEEKLPYDRSCLRDVNDVMPYAIGRVFADNVLSRDDFDKAVKIVAAILDGFQVVLKQFRWASLDVQSMFARMNYIVSYPEWIKNYQRLDDYYDHVQGHGDYFHRYLSASRNRYQRYLTMPNITARASMQMTYHYRRMAEFIFPSRIVDLERRVGPPRENTFYDARDNALIVPSGAMQPPYYDGRSPAGLTFGGLGTMIARDFINEMFHTNEGILRDDKKKNAFKEKTQCLLNAIKEGLDPNMNPDCTSVISDVFSVRVAYEAYQIYLDGSEDDTLQGVAHMTPDQLFFISAVRTLCTNVREQHFAQMVLLRKPVMETDLIDPAVMGMREFEDAFACKGNVSTTQNTFNKCFFAPQSS